MTRPKIEVEMDTCRGILTAMRYQFEIVDRYLPVSKRGSNLGGALMRLQAQVATAILCCDDGQMIAEADYELCRLRTQIADAHRQNADLLSANIRFEKRTRDAKDRLKVAVNALDEIGALSRHTRQGGMIAGDESEYEEALLEAIDSAHAGLLTISEMERLARDDK